MFSRCYINDLNCCYDPMVHDRISRKVKEWIMRDAPGGQDSDGCSYEGRYDEWVP